MPAPNEPTPEGMSIERAIIIEAKRTSSGVAQIYRWLMERYPGFELRRQSTLNSEGMKRYDCMEIKTSSGEGKTFYFDITSFYGK